jgi:hypothetical protein
MPEADNPSVAGRGAAILAAIFIAAHAWFTIGPNLTMPNVNHFDALSQLPWMHRWEDPGLFPNDLMTDYFQTYHAPPGVRACYYALIKWCGLELNVACRVVATVWYVATISLALFVVRFASPGWIVAIGAVAAVLIPFHYTPLMGYSLFSRFDGGLARAAGSAVMLMTMYGIARPNRLASNLAIIIGVAFYPMAAIMAVVAIMVSIVMQSPRRWLPEFACLLPAILLSAVIVWLWYPREVDPRFGHLVNRDDISWAPEIAQLHFPNGDSLFAVGWGWFRFSWIAIVAVLFQAAFSGRDRLLRANVIILVAGAIATLLSYLVWPRLYDMDRYQLLAGNVVLFSALVSVMIKVFESVSKTFTWLNAARLACCAVICYLGFNVALNEFRKVRARPDKDAWAMPGRFGRQVIDMLADSPKDTVVAALGDELDAVPFFARRSLLLPPSAMPPYHRDMHREVVRRFLAIQAATYATDAESLRRLRDTWNVRYLSVNRARFNPADMDRLAGSPASRTWLPNRIAPVVKPAPDHDYFLKSTPRDAVVIEVGDYQLIDLTRLPVADQSH